MNSPTIRRSERDQKRRLQAAALFAEGLSNAEIGRRLHVSRQSVSGWYQTWKAQGDEGLKVQLPGPSCRLSKAQQEHVLEALLEGPTAHGYETPVWTLQRIAQLIVKVTGVSYHPGHVWYLLKALDWSCQKPEPVARERDDAAIERFQSEEWPQIKKGRSSEGPSWRSWMRADSRSNPVSTAPGLPEDRPRRSNIASTGNA